MEVRRRVRVGNREGFHARTCTEIARVASRLRAHVRLARDDRVADATSVFDLMLLQAGHGDVIDVVASGEGAEAAVATLARLVESGLAGLDD